MVWFIFALFNAFFESVKDVFSKHSLAHVDEYQAAWALSFFSLPFLVPILFFIEIPAIGKYFWLILIFSVILNTITTILYMKALKHSDISLSVPMLTFTPLFLLLTSPIMVGEFPSLLGLIGILLIVIGSYVLNIREYHKGYLAPFRKLVKHKGPRLMLLIAFVWSLTSNLDKLGILNSSFIFWIIIFYIGLTISLTMVLLIKSGKSIFTIHKKTKRLLPIGFFLALSSVFQMKAMSMSLVPYVIAIKRTSAVMCVIWGALIFKEKGIKERLFSAIIMVLGVLLITLS